MSVFLPVVWKLPWLKFVSMLPTIVPRPIWAALVPPRPPLTGRLADLMVCVSISLNVTRPDLNPTVLLLAMLLPMTSRFVRLAPRPDTPE